MKRTLPLSLILAAFSASISAQTSLPNGTPLEQSVRAAYLKASANIDAPTISVEEVLPHLKDGHFILVDVRKDAEIAVSKIPGAMSVDEFTRLSISNDQIKNATIVAYCTIGYRSGKFAEKWVTRGFSVRNLEGGILAWAGRSGPLVRRDDTGVLSATTTVHVYGREWNLLPQGYQSVW